MRIGGQEIKPVWLIGGGIGILFVLGLFYDVGQTYFRRKNLERTVRNVAEESAKHLPYRPQDAVTHGLALLQQHGYEPSPSSVTVRPDGSAVEVSVTSAATAYFAWLVGSPKLEFQAKAGAEVSIEGGGPLDEMAREEIAFALFDDPEDPLRNHLRENVLISASGETGVPDYAVKAYLVTAPNTLVVGQKARFALMPSTERFNSPGEWFVVILGPAEEGEMATVKGFAALDSPGLDEKGRILGRFVQKKIAGDLKAQLGEENNFGLVRGGTHRVSVKNL